MGDADGVAGAGDVAGEARNSAAAHPSVPSGARTLRQARPAARRSSPRSATTWPSSARPTRSPPGSRRITRPSRPVPRTTSDGVTAGAGDGEGDGTAAPGDGDGLAGGAARVGIVVGDGITVAASDAGGDSSGCRGAPHPSSAPSRIAMASSGPLERELARMPLRSVGWRILVGRRALAHRFPPHREDRGQTPRGQSGGATSYQTRR